MVNEQYEKISKLVESFRNIRDGNIDVPVPSKDYEESVVDLIDVAMLLKYRDLGLTYAINLDVAHVGVTRNKFAETNLYFIIERHTTPKTNFEKLHIRLDEFRMAGNVLEGILDDEVVMKLAPKEKISLGHF